MHLQVPSFLTRDKNDFSANIKFALSRGKLCLKTACPRTATSRLPISDFQGRVTPPIGRSVSIYG